MKPDLEAQRRELERLLLHRMSLEAAIKEFEHDSRRTRDGLERAGGRSRTLDQKASQLARNIKTNQQELREVTQKIERLIHQIDRHDGV